MEKEEMCRCGQDTVYSKTLTRGLCLNCYQNQEDDNKLMEIECRLNYEIKLLEVRHG